jgi:hypothetical protein
MAKQRNTSTKDLDLTSFLALVLRRHSESTNEEDSSLIKNEFKRPIPFPMVN